MRLWVPVLLVAVTLAGCADSGAPTGDDGLVPDDVVAQGDKGAISGVVVTDTITPIEGATVALQGGDTVTTAADGRFVFEDLDPGFYFIETRAPTYLPIQTTAEVKAGEVVKPKVVLPFDPTPQPYHTTIPFEGYVDASVGLANWAYDLFLANETGIQTCQCIFDFDTDGQAHTFVLEAVWEDSVDPGPYGPTSYYIELDAPSGLETAYVENPARFVVDGTAFDAGETDYQVRLYPDDVWPTSSQTYQLFVTVFYLEGPPEGWSFVDGGQ